MNQSKAYILQEAFWDPAWQLSWCLESGAYLEIYEASVNVLYREGMHALLNYYVYWRPVTSPTPHNVQLLR
jgi:hypothetical protein